MSVFTPKRVFLSVVAVLFVASSVFAANPSPRSYAKLVFDQQQGVGILFGGRGAFDGATQVSHDSNETWLWTGSRWLQRFPLQQPPGRSVHSMVYDSHRGRVVLFGGKQEPDDPQKFATYLNDTWALKDGEWSPVETSDAPSARHYAGMAYDAERDRIVLFGGQVPTPDGKNVESVYDTWEFDGFDWTRVGGTAQPAVLKPVLVWDAARKETIMMGVTGAEFTNVMYRYDVASNEWIRIQPETLPTCVNEGMMAYNSRTQKLVWIGGICASSATSGVEEVFEWDGANWAKVVVSDIGRGTGQAITFDPLRDRLIVYGGVLLFTSEPRGLTYTLKDGSWSFVSSNLRPQPRSLAAFETDPVSGNIWLYGGLEQTSTVYLADLWGYRSGQWFPFTGEGDAPGIGCASPLSAFDSDRGRLVVLCEGAAVFEWDGVTWTAFTGLSGAPESRRFASIAYDKALKRTVLFGGYGVNYRNDTWLWDGSRWTEAKGDKPTHRGLAAMWFDPLQQKVILYGGLGRANINQKITRYSDMWSFNGTGWSKMNVPQTPGERFGPQIAVYPESGKLLLFGGLRSESVDEKSLRQFYDSDTWEWDGAASRWAQLQPSRSAIARENGMLAWDPVAQQMVLFGGYNGGFFLSDVWTFDGQSWQPSVDVGVMRRRVAGPAE